MAAEASSGAAVVRVLRGNPDHEELAALVTALMTLDASGAEPGGRAARRPRWTHSHHFSAHRSPSWKDHHDARHRLSRR
jgi:hypothetical protein